MSVTRPIANNKNDSYQGGICTPFIAHWPLASNLRVTRLFRSYLKQIKVDICIDMATESAKSVCLKLYLPTARNYSSLGSTPPQKKQNWSFEKSQKFSAAGYLFALINAILTGKASFNQLAIGLKHSEPLSLTKQAVWKRTTALAVAFMLDALTLALIEKWREGTCEIPKLKRLFGRVFGPGFLPAKTAKNPTTNTFPPTVMARASPLELRWILPSTSSMAGRSSASFTRPPNKTETLAKTSLISSENATLSCVTAATSA